MSQIVRCWAPGRLGVGSLGTDLYDERRGYIVTRDDERMFYHLSKAMRRVQTLVEKRGLDEDDVTVPKALGLVASELEAMYLGLDPEPVVFLRDVGGNRLGDRTNYGALSFFGPEYVEFRPRSYMGGNTKASDYAEWWGHRV